MIRELRLSDIAAALQLPVPALNAGFTTISTDSRSSQRGDLFVALRGEHFDGHGFIDDVARRGAVAAVVDHAAPCALPQLVVPDTLRALGTIGLLSRTALEAPLIALTGSSGKTTTKEMIAAVLRQRGEVLATQGNLNNEIGVPLTLARMAAATRYAVIEMGASHMGDIAYLAKIARPDIALVTNAAPAHLAGFGSIEAVAAGKGEIYEALQPTGVAILNLDDRFAGYWCSRIHARRILTVSALGRAHADVRAEDITTREGLSQFVLAIGDSRIAISLAIPGTHQVANALMAAATAHAVGISLQEIRSGLQSVLPVSGRMEQLLTSSGCRLINDSYNANPGSVRAAIDTLATWAGERVLVMGQMAELGPGAADMHRDIGRYAREHGVAVVLTTGEFAAALADGFGTDAQVFATKPELIEACRDYDRNDVVMLVKGSRSAAMEQVVNAMMGQPVASAGRAH